MKGMHAQGRELGKYRKITKKNKLPSNQFHHTKVTIVNILIKEAEETSVH